MPEISKINALAIGSVGKVDGLAKASILDIDGVTVPVPITVPTAAFSVRLLGSAVGISSYTGDCMRVRRASDNVEADVGFDAGELKLTSPISNTSDAQSYTDFADFVDHTGTPTNAFVRYWYDQSGNANDATQTTATNQPKIYDSVTGVVTENGKPAVQFDGSDDNMPLSSTLFQSDANFSVFSIGKHTETTTEGGLYDLGGGSVIVSLSFNRGGSNRYGTTNYRSSTIGNGGDTYDQTQSLFSHFGTASTNDVFQDGVQATQGFSARGNFYNSIGKAANYFLKGNAQEFVIYNSDQSRNRTGIETNINGFFSVYP